MKAVPPTIESSHNAGAALSRLQALNSVQGLRSDTSQSHERGKSADDEAQNNSASLFHQKSRYSQKKAPLVSIPSAMELADLRHGARLYKSNLFRLEIEQLLKEVSIDYLKIGPLEKFVKDLKVIIDNLKPVFVSNDLQKQYPFMNFVQSPSQKKHSLEFNFNAPTRCDLVGSYQLKTITRPNLNMDISVEMPKTMFEPKDYLNYRYFNKRAAYIAEMFIQLRSHFPYCKEEEKRGKTDLIMTHTSRDALLETNNSTTNMLGGMRPYFYVQAWNGDVYRPIIVIKLLIPRKGEAIDPCSIPTNETYKCTHWTIRIFPIPPHDVFNENRLSPEKNCVRFCSRSFIPPEIKDQTNPDGSFKQTQGMLPPTPMYNAGILEDLRMRSWLEKFHTVSKKCNGLIQAIQLLKLWGRLRGHCPSWECNEINQFTTSSNIYNKTNGLYPTSLISPISGFLFTIICCHVCISDLSTLARASPIQIFRMALVFLADTDFNQFKVIFGKSVPIPLSKKEQLLGLKLFLDTDLNDSTIPGNYNIFWQCQVLLGELQKTAKSSIVIIDTIKDPFQTLFGNKKDIYYDMVWDMSLIVKDIPHIDSIIPEGSLAETEQLEEERQLRKKSLTTVENNPSMLQTISESIYADIHIENPSHYTLANYFKNLFSRALTNRIMPVGGIIFRFIAPDPTARYCSTDASTTHPIKPPMFTWTDSSPLSTNLVPIMGIIIGLCSSVTEHEGDQMLSSSKTADSWRLVDRGYPAESPLAKHYKQFWGNSQIRRFQDGAINESVVWKQPTPTMENLGYILPSPNTSSSSSSLEFIPNVFIQIIEHILKRHCESYFQIISPFQSCLLKKKKNRGTIIMNSPILGTMNRVTGLFIAPDGSTLQHPTKTFSELKGIILGLPDLPLGIKEFRSADTSGILTYTDPPLHSFWYMDNNQSKNKSISNVDYALETVIQCALEFQKSGGWPVSIEGIYWMKVALLVAIKSKLYEHAAIVSNIGGIKSRHDEELNEPFLDIMYANDTSNTSVSSFLPTIIFRVKIFQPTQYLNIASSLTDTSTHILRLWKEHSNIIEAIEQIRTLWWRPNMNSAIHSAGLQFPCLFPTLRLAKIWAAAHLFPLDSMNDMLSLLCLELFQNPASYDASPSTPHTAFIRLLHILANYDWKSEGLFVAYTADSNTLTSEIRESLTAARRRCLDIANIQESKQSGNNPQCLSHPQVPFFWISSVDDPHCQFIQLPSYGLSQDIIHTARQCLDDAHSFSVNSCVSVNEFSEYIPVLPLVKHLPKHSWRQLFSLQNKKQFHLRIKLRDRFDISMNEKQIMKHNPSTTTKRNRFSNIQPKKLNTQDDPASVKKIETGSQITEETSKIIVEFSSILSDLSASKTQKDSFTNEVSINQLIDSIIESDKLQCMGTHDAMSILHDSFLIYIKHLKELFKGIADIYYNSLSVPYPSYLYIRFHPECMSLNALTPSFSSSCPKSIIVSSRSPDDHLSDNDEINSSDDENNVTRLNKNILNGTKEIINIPVMIGLILNLGHGIIESVDIP